MKVVVTGGAGFIGANLCRRLVADPSVHEVVALDDLSTGFASNLDGVGARLVEGSFLDDDLLRGTLDGANAVVHLGARPSVPRSIADPIATHEANATGTLRVLVASRDAGVEHVVVASSSSIYGANPALPKRETMLPMPMSPYAVSKLATEQYALAWQYSYGMRTLALRFFNVYGPLQAAGHAYAAVVPNFVDAALRGHPVTIHGDGTQSRDFTFVGTVCDVIAEALLQRTSIDSPVNLAFGVRTTVLELLESIERLVGVSVERVHTDSRTGDVKHSQAENELLRGLFPSIEPTPLDTGLQSTIDWMRTTI